MIDTPFEVTDDMRRRHRRWASEYARAVWEQWREDGALADSDAARAGIRHVIREALVLDRREWMHPLRALAVIASVDGPGSLESNVDYLDALRTHLSLDRRDRLRWAARALGVTVDQVKKYDPNREKYDLSGVCYLYRYFDEFGRLLYVGISKDADKRDGQHASLSSWHQFATQRTLEEFESRDEAMDAEALAIRDECPVFNRLGANPGAEDEVLDYLSWRIIVDHHHRASLPA